MSLGTDTKDVYERSHQELFHTVYEKLSQVYQSVKTNKVLLFKLSVNIYIGDETLSFSIHIELLVDQV